MPKNASVARKASAVGNSGTRSGRSRLVTEPITSKSPKTKTPSKRSAVTPVVGSPSKKPRISDEESPVGDDSESDVDENERPSANVLPITNVRNPMYPLIGDALVSNFQKDCPYDLFFHETNDRVGINVFAEMVPVKSLQIGNLVLIPNDDLSEFIHVWQLTGLNTFKLISSATEFPEKSMKFTNSDLFVPVANQLYLDGNNLSFTLSAIVYTKKTVSGDASNPIVVPGTSPAINPSAHYSFSVTDKNESDDKKNIAVAKMFGQQLVDSKFGRILSSAKKLDADFFRQVLDTVSRDDKRFSFANDQKILSAVISGKFATDASNTESRIGNTDLKAMNGGSLPANSAFLSEFLSNFGRFLDRLFETNVWFTLFSNLSVALMNKSSSEPSSFPYRLEKTIEFFPKLSVLVRQDAFLQYSSEEQSVLIRSLFGLSYLTKDDFYTDNFARLSSAGVSQNSKPINPAGASHIKEDKGKVKAPTTKIATTSQAKTATAAQMQGNASTNTHACFNAVCLLAKTPNFTRNCPPICGFYHGPSFSDCSKSETKIRFVKIAKKIWSSDTTVMNLNIVCLEAFIDSKFGKP